MRRDRHTNNVHTDCENVRLYPSPRATLTCYIANGLAQAYAVANAVVDSMYRDNGSQFGLSR